MSCKIMSLRTCCPNSQLMAFQVSNKLSRLVHVRLVEVESDRDGSVHSWIQGGSVFGVPVVNYNLYIRSGCDTTTYFFKVYTIHNMSLTCPAITSKLRIQKKRPHASCEFRWIVQTSETKDLTECSIPQTRKRDTLMFTLPKKAFPSLPYVRVFCC